MTWTELVPAGVAAVALLFLPGIAIGLAARLRFVAMIGAAPAFSVAVIGIAAVLAGLFGFAWGLAAVVTVTAGGVAAAGAVSLVGARLGWRRGHRDGRAVHAAVLIALAGGLLVALASLLPGLMRADAVSQTYDAVFHYNAVRYALDENNASSLHLGTLNQPSADSAFYPGAWHGIVSLIAMYAEPDIIVAANGMSVAVAGLVWPATCVLLVRQVFGGRAAPLVAGGVLSGAFTAFPTHILAFGVLWPNALAYALVPAALAMVITLARQSSASVLSVPHALFALTLALPALALAHPNALFTLGVLALPPILVGSVRFTRQHWREGDYVVAFLPWLGLLSALAAIHLITEWSGLFGDVAAADWRARMTMSQAFGEVLLLATLFQPASWILGTVVLAGLVIALRAPNRRWLVASYAGATVLYILAAGSDSRISLELTGVWYNDAYRLAAALPILALPLAITALDSFSQWASVQLGRRQLHPRIDRSSGPGVVLVAATAVLLVATGIGYSEVRAAILRPSYTIASDDGSSPLLNSGELALLRRLPEIVPEGVGVAGDPWDGSALAMAISDRPVPFPHLQGEWDAPRRVIAERLRNAARDPAVCAAVDALGIGYAIDGGPPLWEGPSFPGLDRLGRVPGFELVDEGGGMRLYRITACAA